MTFGNTGHGHVTPRSDGCKARCGGPALCAVCQREVAGLTVSTALNERIAELATQVRQADSRGDDALRLAHAAEQKLDEVHSWIVCADIASPDDMMQNAERIEALTRPTE